MIQITHNIAIDEKEIKEEFIHASGPGGQNVNKVATAVLLRFDIMNSPSLPDDVRERLIHLSGRRVSREGVLIIKAGRFRTQEKNRRDAIERLINLIQKAIKVPKVRKETKPTQSSRARRLEAKHRHSQIKNRRKSVSTESQ